MTTSRSKPVRKFDPVEAKIDFVKMEERILSWWDKNDIPDRYMRKNEASEKRYSFIDGPITANNPMGVHHAWGRSYKDIFLRFRNMLGYKQRFQNGFDGQGLWVEVEVEKEKGFKSKRDIEAYGVDKFVEECKARVRRFADRISDQSKRLGFFMDWDDSYHTMSDENNYTIWHFLKTCHDNGWVYEGEDVMPWCPRCGTGLSQHEIVTEGYQEIVHPGLFVKFPLLEQKPGSLLVWTTTPWTMAANVAAAVHPEHAYVKVRNTWKTDSGTAEEILWLGKGRLSVLKGEHEILAEVTGSELVGLRYRGPFDELPAQSEASKVHRVVAWEDVGEEEGTGIVHIAPGAGAEDFKLGKACGLPIIAPLDDDGRYTTGFGFLDGRSVSEVNDDIYESMREKGVFYRVEKYKHRYPVCWRCGTELVFRLVSEWFISMDELRPRMMAATERMNWVPSFGKDRELDWLRNMHDWMISKKRYWGLALPIYKCSCGNVDVMGSEHELRERSVEGWEEFEGHSPHRPWVDGVKIACSRCGEKVSRIKDVGNPWLDAGIVPFSTLGYRSNRDNWKDWYPADWISESFPGQFRNWFYSLIAMSAALENREPAKNVFSYALMRDEKGAEMHKSKGNAIWFEDAADKMGVDVMRWLFSRHTPANNLNFGYGPGDEVRRQFIIPLWNIYSFFTTYASLDGWTADRAGDPGQRSELDRWILSELNLLVKRVTDYMMNWRIEYSASAIEQFVDQLSNWYVRRSRRRFWKSEDDGDKQAAYSTLYECLVTLSRLLAPYVPFLAEELYQNLVARSVEDSPGSVHLSDWPKADASLIDEELSNRTQLAIRIVSLGRSARAQSRLRVRQPLAELVVELRHDWEHAALPAIAGQIMEELNVKRVRDASDVGQLLTFSVKPNLPKLGPRLGKDLGRIRQLIEAADPAELARLSESGREVILGEFTLAPEEILVERSAAEGYAIAADAGYTAAVSTLITPELRAEGLARELVHHVQNLRKSAGLEIADRIRLYVEGSKSAVDAVNQHSDYIRDETLAVELSIGSGGTHSEEHEIDGENVLIALARI